jgi:hypothetical protein
MKREASRNSIGADGDAICEKVAQTCFFGYHKRNWESKKRVESRES